MQKFRHHAGLALVTGIGLFLTPGGSAFAGTISWDATYHNDVGLSPSDFNKFQTNIAATLSYYSSTWSTPNDVTVKVEFHAANFGLGSTSSFGSNVSYQAYRNALAATGSSADDATALGFLPNVANNPVNGNTGMRMTLALQRALGLSNLMGPYDARVDLNVTIMTLDRADPMVPGTYDLRQVNYHELNEVLGFQSGLNGVPNVPITVPSGVIQAADLWRYRAPGVRSFTSDVNEACYLSINGGVTNLANYNTLDGGDRQDFNSMPNPSVQDAFSTPDIRLDNALAEETFLDVIGYNRMGCVADVDDGSGTGTRDGGVTIDDLLYYLQIFQDGVIAADVDDGSFTGTRDGGVTIDDLLYFLFRFEAGC